MRKLFPLVFCLMFSSLPLAYGVSSDASSEEEMAYSAEVVQQVSDMYAALRECGLSNDEILDAVRAKLEEEGSVEAAYRSILDDSKTQERLIYIGGGVVGGVLLTILGQYLYAWFKGDKKEEKKDEEKKK